MLEEIFKTNPALLQEPEVQNLIEYVQKQHQVTVNKFIAMRDCNWKAMDLVMYSDAILIDGKPAKETLLEIYEAL